MISVMTLKYGHRRKAQCARCGKTFRRIRKGHSYCSGACRQGAWVSTGGALRALKRDLAAWGLATPARRTVTHACPLCGQVHQAKRLQHVHVIEWDDTVCEVER